MSKSRKLFGDEEKKKCKQPINYCLFEMLQMVGAVGVTAVMEALQQDSHLPCQTLRPELRCNTGGPWMC